MKILRSESQPLAVKKKDNSMDALRVLTICLVVGVHVTSEPILNSLGHRDFGISFYVLNLVSSFSHICVPLFVLLSGRFLLGSKDSMSVFYKKRMSRILVPLLFWTAFYSLYTLWSRYESFGEWQFNLVLKAIVKGEPYYHMWYLYMLISLYLIVPVINVLLPKVSSRIVLLVGIGLIMFGLVNNAYNYVAENRLFFPLWFIDYLGYFILGYALKDKSLGKPLVLLALFFLSGFVYSYFSATAMIEFNSLYFYTYLSPFVILGALLLYSFFNQVKFERNVGEAVTSAVFGIYLIHPIVMEFLNSLDFICFENKLLEPLVLFVLVLIFSFILVGIIRRVPMLERIV